MPDPTHLLWLDLETTGTHEAIDQVIEIAVILTDLELTEVTRNSNLVPYDYDGALRLAGNDYVRQMHQTSGLIDDLGRRSNGFNPDSGVEHEVRWSMLRSAEKELRAQLVYAGAQPHCVMLAGSGVSHFDRRFLRTQLPDLERQLAYPSIDVGVARRMADMWGTLSGVPDFNSGKTHRAMADVTCHLDEARWWRDLLGEVL